MLIVHVSQAVHGMISSCRQSRLQHAYVCAERWHTHGGVGHAGMQNSKRQPFPPQHLAQVPTLELHVWQSFSKREFSTP